VIGGFIALSPVLSFLFFSPKDKMMLTKEQLLKPRFKLIQSFPNQQDYVVDKVIEPGNSEREILREYPHLFKELLWWEDRQLEDMPQKIAHKLFPDEVFKVERWSEDLTTAYLDDGKSVCRLDIFKPGAGYFPID
jgi:hypothetical protein